MIFWHKLLPKPPAVHKQLRPKHFEFGLSPFVFSYDPVIDSQKILLSVLEKRGGAVKLQVTF